MTCPRCTHEIGANQSSCLYCGFVTLASPCESLPVEESVRRRDEIVQGQRVGSNRMLGYANEGFAQSASRYFQPYEQFQKRTLQPSLRTTRFVPNASLPGEIDVQSSVSSQFTLPLSSPLVASSVQEDLRFPAWSFLGGGRYRITGKQEHQQWTNDVYETCWKAQDLLWGEANVIICEAGLPEMRVITRQAYLRAAMKGFFKAGMHSRIPTLTNVFREGGRDFFVFDSIEGETLLARMQRTGQPLQEREVIAGCLQIAEVLEALSEQEPPLMNGLISPGHLIITHTGQWFLTGFSIVLACGANEYLTDLDPASFTAFIAPEFTKGSIDSRADLYALLATAYFSVTGRLFTGTDRNGSRVQPWISQPSPSFDAILKKGLHSIASQRYQQISALYQDLLVLSSRSISKPLSGRSMPLKQEQGNTLSASMTNVNVATPQKQSIAPEMRRDHDTVAHVLSSLASSDDLEVPVKNLLPRPEELLPMRQGNDRLVAVLWMGVILTCLLIPVLIK